MPKELQQRLDLVIFGATGFTGKHAVMELARICVRQPINWGIAGRNISKLEDVLREARQVTGADLSNVRTFIADVTDPASLAKMCSQTTVVASCCGPYRHYGEPLVKAAVDNKTHYVDVSGEPEFIETMQLRYHHQARDAGVFIISACGFDSIPTDLGVQFLEQQFNGTLNSVESYLSVSFPRCRPLINVGTWESLVYGISHINDLAALRKQIYPTPLPDFEPKLARRWVLHRRLGGWCLPFPGSDASVVYRTQRHLYETDSKRPVHIRTYVRFRNLLYSLLVMFMSVLLYILTRSPCTRSILVRHPRLFSLGLMNRDGPSEDTMNNTSFEFQLIGEGWASNTSTSGPPNRVVTARVSGVNPGYGATVVALLYSAITILTERDRMPAQGGVLTTGAAFRNTNLIENLNKNNLQFQIVSSESI